MYIFRNTFSTLDINFTLHLHTYICTYVHIYYMQKPFREFLHRHFREWTQKHFREQTQKHFGVLWRRVSRPAKMFGNFPSCGSTSTRQIHTYIHTNSDRPSKSTSTLPRHLPNYRVGCTKFLFCIALMW